MRRLRRGEIAGYKVGHDWRMTHEHVEALIAKHMNTPQEERAAAEAEAAVEGPAMTLTHDAFVAGLSGRARRRMGIK